MSASEGAESSSAHLLVACGAAVAAAWTLDLLDAKAYPEVLGIERGALPTLVLLGLGYVSLRFLQYRKIVPSGSGGRRGWRTAILVGGMLPIPMIVADCFGGFDRDINAPFLEALLFYPSVALAAEFGFHVLAPAHMAASALFWRSITPRWKVISHAERYGFLIAVVAEPLLQMSWSARHSPRWVVASVGLHLLVFNAIGVHLLRRYGFMHAYLYRISYYVVWHILWGQLRIPLLFPS